MLPLPRPAPPPLSDTAAWQIIIANATIDEFRPEDVLAAYDARDATYDDKVANFVLKYFFFKIDGLLYTKFWRDEPGFAAQCRDETRSRILEAILDRTVNRGEELRAHFNQIIVYTMMAVKTQLSIDHRRSSGSKELEKAPQGRLEPEESKIIRKMDHEKARARLLARAPLRKRERLLAIFDLTMAQKSRDEVATAVGISIRQLRRELNKIIEILAEPDAK
ncbi:MAG: hypothetical protein ACYC5H_06680 [Methylovirgula sp.]